MARGNGNQTPAASAGHGRDRFLNVVFDHRTVGELRHILPKTWANTKASVLLPMLFPKRRSWIFFYS